MRCPLHYRDSEDSRLCAAYSTDGGWSWQPVELAVNHHSPLITCAGVVPIDEGSNTRYLLPVHLNTLRHDPLGRRDQLVLESTNLLEWRLAGYIPQPQDGKVFMHEGNIALGDADEELKIVMRTSQYAPGGGALEPPVAYSSVSRDGGRTWSPGQPELALYNTISKAYFGRDSNGNHVYVYSTGPAESARDWRIRRRDLGKSGARRPNSSQGTPGTRIPRCWNVSQAGSMQPGTALPASIGSEPLSVLANSWSRRKWFEGRGFANPTQSVERNLCLLFN